MDREDISSQDERVQKLELQMTRIIQAGLAISGVLDELLMRTEAAGVGLDQIREVALQEYMATIHDVLVELADRSPEPA